MTTTKVRRSKSFTSSIWIKENTFGSDIYDISFYIIANYVFQLYEEYEWTLIHQLYDSYHPAYCFIHYIYYWVSELPGVSSISILFSLRCQFISCVHELTPYCLCFFLFSDFVLLMHTKQIVVKTIRVFINKAM